MRRFPTISSLVRMASLIIVVAVISACGASTPAEDLSPGASPAPSAAASCDSGAWGAAPVHVSHSVGVPPVPVITAVRTAAHPECGYDRLVLDINGPVPSYDVRYVTQVTADPSGRPIALPGRSYLLITLRPAQAHAGSGASPVIRTAQHLGYPMLRSYAVAGDFEGVFSVALGLQSTTSIRVGELPGHLYIDVRA